MSDYNAILTTSRRDPETIADDVFDQLADYHPAIGVDHRGRTTITITLPADRLGQAITTARIILANLIDAYGGEALQVLTTAEFDRGDMPIPPLRTIAEAAEQLGVSRQAVRRRIERGTLPAVQIGEGWAIPAAGIQPTGYTKPSQDDEEAPVAGPVPVS